VLASLGTEIRMIDPQPDPGDHSAAPQPGVESFVDSFPCALYGYVRWPDGRNRFVYMSAQAEGIFGHSPERILAEPELLWSLVHPEDVERLAWEDEAANRTGQPFNSEARIVMPSGELKWIQLASVESPQLYEGRVMWSGMILDITERKRAEEENARLLDEFQEVMSRIRKLEGIIPICGFCKRIRDDEGAWEQFDVYVRRHSDAEFSDGICPACVEEHYPGL